MTPLTRHQRWIRNFDERTATVALDYDTLIQRAESRSEASGDYWDRSAQFLRDLKAQRARGPVELSRKQQSWLSALKQDLMEPWE